MRKRELERLLNGVPPHPTPKVELEQYSTPSTLASTLLWICEQHYRDISGKRVLDLGAGTGRLGLGAALLGADYVVLLEIDEVALRVAGLMARRYDVDSRVDSIVADAEKAPFRTPRPFHTVVQNPPFGVHKRGRDVLFLEKALQLADRVYSIHKESGHKYIVERFTREGFDVTILYRDKVCIPPMFEWHRERRHCFPVVVLRVRAQADSKG